MDDYCEMICRFSRKWTIWGFILVQTIFFEDTLLKKHQHMGVSKRKRRSNLTMDEPQIRFGSQVKASWDF